MSFQMMVHNNRVVCGIKDKLRHIMNIQYVKKLYFYTSVVLILHEHLHIWLLFAHKDVCLSQLHN